MNFVGFPKMARLSKDCVISEKLDGTNAQIVITEDGDILAGSRTRWITPEDDNFGFARWVQENSDELMKLGVGQHFGEFWGKGIQRNYGLSERRFSLFNTERWSDDTVRPACCHVVPMLYRGPFSPYDISVQMWKLEQYGSVASPGFMKPEGIVIFHTGSQTCFKKTLDGDGHKGAK